jgi:PEP-CTERM motif
MFADDLSWGGTWAGVWQGFGTGPYTAIDHSQNNKVLVIFCLDYNDEIAPPYDWQANIRPVTPTNVTQYAQFGGNYGQGITATPWSFTGDAGAGSGHSVDLAASATAYTRYLEAAWLFSNILTAQSHGDLNSMIVSQVAAWDLFVESTRATDLKNRITATNSNGPYTFRNYAYSTDNYATAPTTFSMSNLLFQNAVNEALNAAQHAVVDQNWYASPFAPSWDLVTGDPAFARAYGRPVQEFLTDAPPVPEPASIVLFGTVALAAFVALRRKHAASTGR